MRPFGVFLFFGLLGFSFATRDFVWVLLWPRVHPIKEERTIAIDIEYFELQDSLFSVGYLNELSSSLNNCQAPE